MFYYIEASEGWDIITCVIIAHIIMWAFKMLVKGIRKAYRWNKARKEREMMAQVKAMMEQSKLNK